MAISDNSAQDQLAQLQSVLTSLQEQLAQQKAELVAHQRELDQLRVNQPDQPLTADKTSSRRRILKRLAISLLTVGVAGGMGLGSSEAQARIVVGSNPGTIAARNGTSITGTPPSMGRYGLVATGDTSLNLGNIFDPFIYPSNIGIYACGTNTDTATAIGIVGESVGSGGTLNQSIGVRGISDYGTGTVGISIYGQGISGYCDQGVGVRGESSTGYGVQAGSNTNAQLRFIPKASAGAPVGGTHQIGELWLDSAGALFIYTSSGWKQVQVA